MFWFSTRSKSKLFEFEQIGLVLKYRFQGNFLKRDRSFIMIICSMSETRKLVS
jgi:hypothetical protein